MTSDPDGIGSILEPANWNLRQEQFALRPNFFRNELRAESNARKLADVGMHATKPPIYQELRA